MIENLIDLIARRTRLDAGQARAVLAGALGLLDRHAAREPMTALYVAIPSAHALTALPEAKAKSGGGLLGGLMKSAGGVSGAAIADAMGLLSRLQKQGVDKADLKAALPLAQEWVRTRAGRDLLGEAMASVPGLGNVIANRRLVSNLPSTDDNRR